jgi:SAM-dependent methyltransferase
VSGAEENAKLWGNFSLANELSPAQRHRWRLVVRELSGLPESSVVVDLGCGSGTLLERIGRALPEARLVGLDADQTALAMATKRLPSAQFKLIDLDSEGETPDLRGTADAVVCSEVIEHLETPQRALTLARQLLRSGGRLVVTVPAGPMNDFDRAIGHRKHYTVAELTELLSTAGFDEVRAAGWGFPFHTLFRMALAIRPATTEQFTDEKISGIHRTLFTLLNALFYCNIRSRNLGRQLIATAKKP